ncbi:MAG: hypothetical protein WKF81_09710 [Thermomicrobiales bacterium]
MFIRIISTFAMLGLMSSGYSSKNDNDEETMGGEGMSGIFVAVTLIALIVLVVIIGLAVMSLTGQFESEFADPVT